MIPAPPEPDLRPDAIYMPADRRFGALIQGNAAMRRVAGGFEWTEGPVWFADHQLLLFSDIPSARILRLTDCSQLSVFRSQSDYANGHTRDREGRLVSCQHGTRSVTRTEFDGRRTVIADAYEGRPLNSPNDVVVAADGAIWFTDPSYGILCDYEGYRATPAQPHRGVYRVPAGGGAPELMIDDFAQPNGLAFSPCSRRLYVADSGRSHDPGVEPAIRAFDLDGRGGLRDAGVFCTLDAGFPDGLRVDAEGNVWTSAADGVHVFAPDGAFLGRILVPEVVANLCFGGPRMNRLYICATTSVYSVAVATRTVA